MYLLPPQEDFPDLMKLYLRKPESGFGGRGEDGSIWVMVALLGVCTYIEHLNYLS